MSKKIYVGNLSFKTTEEGLISVFSQFGTVISAQVVRDRYTEQSRGFGFVEMELDEAADEAIATINGQMIDGRRVRVNLAEEKPMGFNQGRPENRSSYGGQGGSYHGGGRRGSSQRNHPRERSSRGNGNSWDYSY